MAKVPKKVSKIVQRTEYNQVKDLKKSPVACNFIKIPETGNWRAL